MTVARRVALACQYVDVQQVRESEREVVIHKLSSISAHACPTLYIGFLSTSIVSWDGADFLHGLQSDRAS